MNSLFLTDGYKTSHNKQYPEGTTLVFSNFTPRSDNHANDGLKNKGVVVFGIQYMLKVLKEHFDKNFFMTQEREAFSLMSLSLYNENIEKLKRNKIDEVKKEFSLYLGMEYDTTHFEELWDLGYLPIEVRALAEGTISPIKVPVLTVHNTLPEFYWVTNYLESIISNLLWKPITSATIAREYKNILNHWAIKTTGSTDGTEWQGHDFSMRGMDSIEAVVSSGLGHLTSFMGTDSLPAIFGARHFYGETGFVAGSVPATEHSVMCAGSKEGELETFRRLLNTYPTGILSVVSDTWDLWNVITNILPQLKEEILARDGKLVIRPDSGDPVDILCGEHEPYRVISKKVIDELFILPTGQKFIFIEESGENKFYTKTKDGYVDYVYEPKHKGVIELLWDIFGGTTNEQGYKVLNPHIGAIYGDSITLERADEICRRLENKGFASTNVVFGIGSFTYQFNTRDSFGFAMKATYVEKEVEVQVGTTPENLKWTTEIQGFDIFKDPVTDNGLKKSAKGLLKVIKNTSGELIVKDGITWVELEQEDNLLVPVFKDGKFYNETSLTEIRKKLNEH